MDETMSDGYETWNLLAVQVAREHGRVIGAEEANFLLWDRTSFPFGSRENVEAELRAHFKEAGDDR